MAKATNALTQGLPGKVSGLVFRQNANDPDGFTFRYTATAKNTSLAAAKIIVTATDNPGNETAEPKTL